MQDGRCRMEDAGWKMQDGSSRKFESSLCFLDLVSCIAVCRIQDTGLQDPDGVGSTSNIELRTSNVE
jgi:hypothetical protein